jgi:transcriptional regulator with XRE-family HTH domain
LRNFRKSKGITQEELAYTLGVSFQSISKWERGESYPDITMLPTLAGYFVVTIENLMGVNRMKTDKEWHEFGGMISDYWHKGKFTEVLKILREAAKQYPEHYGIKGEIAYTLTLLPSAGKAELVEAIELCEDVLENYRNAKQTHPIRALLCLLYDEAGDKERAIAYGRTLPHLWESREMIRTELYEGEEYQEELRKTVISALSLLKQRINGDHRGDHLQMKKDFNAGMQTDADFLDNGREALKVIGEFLGRM